MVVFVVDTDEYIRSISVIEKDSINEDEAVVYSLQKRVYLKLETGPIQSNWLGQQALTLPIRVRFPVWEILFYFIYMIPYTLIQPIRFYLLQQSYYMYSFPSFPSLQKHSLFQTSIPSHSISYHHTIPIQSSSNTDSLSLPSTLLFLFLFSGTTLSIETNRLQSHPTTPHFLSSSFPLFLFQSIQINNLNHGNKMNGTIHFSPSIVQLPSSISFYLICFRTVQFLPMNPCIKKRSFVSRHYRSWKWM